MDKFLIVGLGNIGDEYENTRHNTGFMVLDAFAKASNIHFEDRRYGFVAQTSLKGRQVLLLKPSTFMNLSGNAVRYWLPTRGSSGFTAPVGGCISGRCGFWPRNSLKR